MVQKTRKSIEGQALASRQSVREWISEIETRFSVSRAEIAKRADVKPSTIYRWFDDKFSHVPSYSAIRRIAAAFSIDLPGASIQRSGFAESDAARYEGPPAEFAGLTPDQSDWTLTTRALELAGFKPGDVVRLDMKAVPEPGDAVFAQVYNFELGTAETRFRLYDPPYLVTRTMDPSVNDRPLYVDGERVVIMGPIVRTVRTRFGSL